jgi:hypothetical protein
MDPRRLAPAVLLLALVVAACGSQASSAAPSRSTATEPPASSVAPAASAAAATCDAAPVPAANAAWNPPATPPTLVPFLVTNAVSCGKARILFLYLDSSNRVASAPDRTAKVAFYNLGRDPDKPVVTANGTFVWTIQDERGMYVVDVDLPEAGTWGAEFTTQAPGSPAATARLTFDVLDSPTAVAIGQKAPASKTPTAADVGGDLTKLSTDAKPDPAFYKTSVADALAAKKPIILIFATPKFCTSQQCGPTLDHFKPIAAAHPEVTFINVEPYKLQFVDGALQPVLDSSNNLIATDITEQWGLLSEPWMFAIDRNGIVRGSYEVTMTPAELDAILPVISAGG